MMQVLFALGLLIVLAPLLLLLGQMLVIGILSVVVSILKRAGR